MCLAQCRNASCRITPHAFSVKLSFIHDRVRTAVSSAIKKNRRTAERSLPVHLHLFQAARNHNQEQPRL